MKDKLLSIWRHFAFNYNDGGLVQILRKIAFRIWAVLWAEAEWLVYRRSLTTASLANPGPLDFRALSFEDLSVAADFKARAFPEVIRKRIKRNERCFGIFIEGVLANVTWVNAGRLELRKNLYLPCPDGAGIFDCYTYADYRGQGLYPAALALTLRILKTEGVQVALIAVNPGNFPSIRGIEKAGFAPMFMFRFKRRFGLSFTSKHAIR